MICMENVWEWCSDWYHAKYYKTSPKDNPKGTDSGSNKVLRGGSWWSDANYCRSASRNCDTPTSSVYLAVWGFVVSKQ